MNKQQTNDDTEYLFNVDLMITGKSNAVALQKLLNILNNHEDLADFRIVSGVKLGQKIEQSIQAAGNRQQPVNVNFQQNTSAKSSTLQETFKEKHEQQKKAAAAELKHTAELQSKIENDMGNWLSLYIQGNQLIRLTINRRGERFSIPCRILKFDNEDQTISVYHVDEKQVYTFKLNEIDDFQHA